MKLLRKRLFLAACAASFAAMTAVAITAPAYPASAAQAAPAAKKPYVVVYAFDNANGWTQAKVRPKTMSVMQGGFTGKDIAWAQWSYPAKSKKKTKLNDSGTPGTGTIKLFHRLTHNHQGYYSEMQLIVTHANPNGSSSSQTFCLKFGDDGSKVPQWYTVTAPEKGCTPSIVTAAATASATTVVTPKLTIGDNSHGCKWRIKGGRHRGYIFMRMIKDTCAKVKLRLRVAGKCSVAGWETGNWINKIRQLTSNLCPGFQGYLDWGIDYQYWWPKSARLRHGNPRGKVRYVSLDPPPSASLTASSIVTTAAAATASTPHLKGLPPGDLELPKHITWKPHADKSGQFGLIRVFILIHVHHRPYTFEAHAILYTWRHRLHASPGHRWVTERAKGAPIAFIGMGDIPTPGTNVTWKLGGPPFPKWVCLTKRQYFIEFTATGNPRTGTRRRFYTLFSPYKKGSQFQNSAFGTQPPSHNASEDSYYVNIKSCPS